VVPGDAGFAAPPSLVLREVRTEEQEDWIRLILRGFLETDEVSSEMLEMMRPSAGPSRCLLAAVDGKPIGGAMMGVQQRVGLFYGDATSKEARGLGVQSALIRYRVALAARLGCDLAMASVIPGSISNRNYERAGFQLVYMRVNVKREW
jgi:GNAT superfamily N-acetyltransferase